MIVRLTCKGAGGWAMCAAITLLAASAARAQTPDTSTSSSPQDCAIALRSPGLDAAADLARVLSLYDSTTARSGLLHRSGRPVSTNACAAPAAVARIARSMMTPSTGALQLEPAELLVIGNSAYPRDWNDGALWGGRGVGMSLTAGASLRVGPLSAVLMPVVTWQSNRAFDIQSVNTSSQHELSHPWWGLMLDAPQRFGDASFGRIDVGHSAVRVDVRQFAAGLSNQHIIWGPARRNPLLLSGTAPGFPHAFVETDGAVDIWIGRLEAQLFWGRLSESKYFDADPDNDARVLAGAMFAFEPRGVPGLAFGAGRTQSFTWWSSLSLSEVLLRPYRGVTENPQDLELGDNQLITAFFRWSAAPWGLEVYGEWARDDHWGTWTQLLRNLDASQAWTLGFQKIIRRDDDALRVAAEITHLADALPVLFGPRGVVPFYSNTSVPQGHTQRGQMLGAPIGTGAESQWLGVDYFSRHGRTSVSIERARYEDDAYHVLFASQYGAGARDTELSLRAGHLLARGPFALDAEVGWSLRYNRSFLGLGGPDGEPFRRDDNLSVRIGTRWTPR